MPIPNNPTVLMVRIFKLLGQRSQFRFPMMEGGSLLVASFAFFLR
jgi:hypothetical protein